MKKLFLYICLLFLSLGFSVIVVAQKTSDAITIILLRHAEKDAAGGDDPSLSKAGFKRAQKLPARFSDVKPDAFYSTNYTRTIQTLKPWAKAAGKQIEIYNASNSLDFVETLEKQKGKTIVVSGHSNTIPSLVNLLIGYEKYKTMTDDEYGTYYVVTIENGKAESQVFKY